ncbi:MAG TPA: AsmA-like C-terminal region-containing protein [Alphaproteobacteria bacterium]|nr:AsmA-like C-terminal region-containing protein [Alphaproteobacteria bacterium]
MDDTSPRTRRAWLRLLPAAVIGAIGAAVLAFELWGAAWLLPVLASHIEAQSGLRLSVAGPVKPDLVPSPGLHAEGVQLAPRGPAAQPLIQAETADIELSWSALLRGRIAIARVRLLHSRLPAVAALPASDIDVTIDGPAIALTATSGDTSLRGEAHRDGDTLAFDRLALRRGDLISAAGAGRLSLHDPIRLVFTADLSAADRPAGDLAVALAYSADGLVLERAAWHRPDGLDINVFGHVALIEGALRFEGGVDAASDSDQSFDASAAFDGRFGTDGLSASLSNIDVRSAGSHLTGDARLQPGRLAASLQVDRLDVAALRHSPLSPLAAAAAPLAFDTDAAVHLRADQLVSGGASVGEGIIVDASRHAGTFDLHELAARSLWGVPLRATGRLAVGPAPVAVFDALHLNYGDVEANGRLTLDATGVRPRLTGELATGPLQLDKLFAGPPPPQPEPMTRKALAAAKARPPSPAPGWSTQPLAVPVVVPVDADVAFAAPSLAWRGYRLADIRGRLQAQEHALALSDVTAGAYGGRISFNGRIEQADVPHVTMGLALAGADLGAVLADFGVRDMAVHGDLGAELTADGRSAADLAATLSGRVSLGNGTGVVTGVDLAAISERLKQRPARPTDVIQLARAASGGRTPFSSLAGHFRIDRGTARTDDLHLTAATAAARLSGSLDLPRQTLDVVTEFQLTDPAGVPPLIVKLDGPFAEPRRVFDISRLQSYLVHRRD